MTPGWAPLAGMVAVVALLVAVAGLYFGRVELPRPPIGTFRRFDVFFMSVMVVVAPIGYLELPRTAVAVVFGLVFLAAVQLVLAPLTGGGKGFVLAAALSGATAACWRLDHPLPTLVLTDLVLALGVVGVANLWVQGGLRAGHAAWFALLVGGYDLVATGLTDLTSRLATEVRGLPFAPVFALTTGRTPVSIGLGDLLMLVLFPLAAAKAFGAAAGRFAGLTAVGLIAGIALLFRLGALTSDVPLLTVLGPWIFAQYLFWRRRRGRERTTEQWRTDVPPTAAAPDPLPPLEAALALAVDDAFAPGDWLAIVAGEVVGSGASPGLARKAARENGQTGMPVVRQV